jgi:hypothetical protein
MKPTRAAQRVTEHGAGDARGHPRERTGVRFVLTNAADSSQTDDYSAWYDDYERAIIYDIVSPDPASAWPATENSPDYPSYLFDDPRSRLVVPAFRASYALTATLEIDDDHGVLTGVHIILSDGGTDTVRAQRAAAFLKTGFFLGASRFRIIEGSPEPPACLEVFETDREDPLTAYARACAALATDLPADGAHERSSHPFVLVAVH